MQEVEELDSEAVTVTGGVVKAEAQGVAGQVPVRVRMLVQEDKAPQRLKDERPCIRFL